MYESSQGMMMKRSPDVWRSGRFGELVFRCCGSLDCMFQHGGLNGSVESGFGQWACVCPIWPQLKHLILVKSRPCQKGGRYPCPEVNGVRGDPGSCNNDGVIVGCETPCPVHCERSIMANIPSESSSSSTAKACSAGLCILTDGLRLAKSVHTSINVWSFRSFWVRITTHKYFLSSGSDCLRTNCSLINSWRSSCELCG